jgi:CRISPR-associated protein Cas1
MPLRIDGSAILAAGYAPAIGFLHSGKPLSFVYDIADLFKFETVVPVAMQIAGQASNGKSTVDPVGEVRRACRDVFRRTLLLQNIIPTIEAVLVAGDIPLPRLEREDD